MPPATTSAPHAATLPFRFAVLAPADADGLRGTVLSGTVHRGDRVRLQPLGRETRVAGIDGETDHASAGQTVTLRLDPPVPADRGTVISTIDAPAAVADQFEAKVVWRDSEPLFPGRRYPGRIGFQDVQITVTDIKYELDPNTLERLPANQLRAGGVAVCNVSTDRPVAFDPHPENPLTGAFALLDCAGTREAGIGMLHFALRRAENIHLQHVEIHKAARSGLKRQHPCVVWFTGLSGSGKSTIANRVEARLHALGHHTYLLDGDNVRHGLNRDLGFTEADRVENIRRIGEVAKLMVDAGLIVLTAFISPFRAERRMARDLLHPNEFVEVFVDVPLAIAEERDPKGLYKKARRGDLKNFTGIDSPYEAPESPELHIDTSRLDPDAAAARVIEALQARGRLHNG